MWKRKLVEFFWGMKVLCTWPYDYKTWGNRQNWNVESHCTFPKIWWIKNTVFALTLLSCNHLDMYEALLYFKKILPASSFTYSKGFMIGLLYKKIRGLKLLARTVTHPVWKRKSSSCRTAVHGLHEQRECYFSDEFLLWRNGNDNQNADHVTFYTIWHFHFVILS